MGQSYILQMSNVTANDGWDLIPNWVGEVIAFHPDGRPLARLRSGKRPEVEVDPLSATVIAFQGMIADYLGERGRPVSAVYGEKVLSLVPGDRVHVATVVRGQPDPELRASMAEAVSVIEDRWGTAIGAWSGSPWELEGLADDMAPVMERTADRTDAEVADPMNVRGVFPVSSVDYEGGCARLKVAVFSASLKDVRGGFLELSYHRDSLRLEGSHPAFALTAEGTIKMGNIAVGEEGVVACMLEPLVPGRHLVETTVTFFDDANNPRHLEVPAREFDVLFPDLAMDVPAIEGLHGADEALRSWRYPASLGGVDVMRTARTVLGTRGLVLHPGPEDGGPPPSWSVEGRAFAGRTPLSMGLTVTGGEVRRLEVRAASTDAAVTAGALAEMRRLLEDAFFRRWRGQVELEEEGGVGPGRPAPDVPVTDIDIYVPWR
jgi:hypothetical protein